MDKTVSSKLKFDLAAAATCCPVMAGNDPPGIARYLKTVLDMVFKSAELHVEVAPIPYQSCCKVPMQITIGSHEPKLLWYYKRMSAQEVSSELFGLLADLPLDHGIIPA